MATATSTTYWAQFSHEEIISMHGVEVDVYHGNDDNDNYDCHNDRQEHEDHEEN